MFFLADAALFALFLLCFVCVGWGIGDTRRPILETTVLPPMLWLGTFGLISWWLGLAGFYSPRFVSGFSVLFFASPLFYAPFSPRFRTNVRRVGAAWRSLGSEEKILSAYLLGVCALMFALTLAPPTGNDYDSLVYHLAVPAQYLREGRILELAFDHHSYFPFTLEMWFGAGLALRGAVLAKLFHWLMLPVCAALLVTLGTRGGYRRGGLWAAALFVSLPLTLSQAPTAYIDLGFTAFTLGALVCLLAARQGDRVQNLALCGAFCGFALGTKYFGILIFGFTGAWVLIEAARNRCFRPILALVLPAILLGSPWYVRNEIWVGNPVFPFAYELFGGTGWTLQMARDYTESQEIYGFGKGVADLLLLPWRLAMTPLNVGVFGGDVRGQPFWPLISGPAVGSQTGLFDVRGLFLHSFVGPALLALGLPAMLRRRHGALAPLAAFFLFLWVFWALSSQQVRYLFPALATLSVLAGVFWVQTRSNKPVFRWLTTFCLVSWLAYSPALTLWRARDSLGVIGGKERPEAFLRRTLGVQTVFEWIGAYTPKNARFAVYGEPRGFGLPRAYFWADSQHNTLVSRVQSTNTRSHTSGPGVSLFFALHDLGATHVLVNTAPQSNGGVFGPPPAFSELVSQGMAHSIFSARGYLVYELAPLETVIKQQGATQSR